MTDKIFLFSIGAQKAGTSWLYQSLKKNYKVNFGIAKEYHIWDALHIPSCSRFDLRQRYTLQNYLKYYTKIPYTQLKIRKKMQENPDYYISYFKSILTKKNLTGDITPSYAGLSSVFIKNLADKFKKENITLKVVFLLRDPYKRALSAYKMHVRNKRIEEVDAHLNFSDGFKKYFMSKHCKLRTQYEKTIFQLNQIKDDVPVYIDSYESIFLEKKLEGLNNFIGCEISEMDIEKKYNYSPKNNENYLNEDLFPVFTNYYKETYTKCFEEFPDLTRNWRKL